MFSKILIANRGEIAVRFIQSARKLNIKTVAVYAAVEKGALHVKMADEAYCLGQSELAETYLNISGIMEVARKSQSQAVYPGYGFLSENEALVQACKKDNITFIGPPANAIRLMGNKIAARNFVKSIGVPVTDGITGNKAAILEQKNTLPYPILVKAASGGGGKGMRIVQQKEHLQEALEATSREAQAYFGDGTVYVEKYLEQPRHIEFQLLADHHGQVVHLFERECSVQRRYQKIIEEAPSPTLDEELRKKMGEAAINIGKKIGYTNAGTIEFLLDKDKNFYFLEMNTRVQVEHPVTEMTTGIDIVAEQISIAAGKPLSFSQEDIKQEGHAIECRVYAESPENNFMPSPGYIQYYHAPRKAGVRLDTAITGPAMVDSRYDPMIGKLITQGHNRAQAITKAVDALKNYVIHGIDTNIPFLIHFLQLRDFRTNHISTKYCDQHAPEIIREMTGKKQKLPRLPVIAGGLLFDYPPAKESNVPSVWQQIGFWRHIPTIKLLLNNQEEQVDWKKQAESNFILRYENQDYSITRISNTNGLYRFKVESQTYACFISENEDGSLNITYEGTLFHQKRQDILSKADFTAEEASEATSDNKLVSPMPGKVIKLYVRKGDKVKKGDKLLIVEAMKMENNILAPHNATVKEVRVSEQEMIERHATLILLE